MVNKLDKTVMIVGLSSGFYVAEALQYHVKKLILVDGDKMDIRNTNRLPFRIGEYKAEEASGYITRCEVVPITSMYSVELLNIYEPDIVIDVTDNLRSQEKIFTDTVSRGKLYIRIGTRQNRITITGDVMNVWDMEEETENVCTEQQLQRQETLQFLSGYIANMFTQSRFASFKEKLEEGKTLSIEVDKIIKKIINKWWR